MHFRTVLRLAFIVPAVPVLAYAQAAGVVGTVRDAETRAPVVDASVVIEGTELTAISDSTGRSVLPRVPPGPHVLVVQRMGYATARVPVIVPARGFVSRDVELAPPALQLPGLLVTADPAGRARKELGTATVIDREAVAHKTATSLAGVLELVPGVAVQPPGIAGVQQIGLRTVPTSSVTSVVAGGPTPSDLASFGTLILLDGVPLSNNANLQTTGPRGEIFLSSSARGGIDLRRIPASTIERVEVIRGVPSARYGDLTQGAIVVETRAGEFAPEARTLLDPASAAGSLAGGWRAGQLGTLAAAFDGTRTRLAPGWRRDGSYRLTGRLSHRLTGGWMPGQSPSEEAEPAPRFTLDSRLELYQVVEDSPEDTVVQRGRASRNRDGGLRVSGRARVELTRDTRLEVTASLENQRQRSSAQSLRVRPAIPFTDRLDEGRSFGRFIGGEYLSRFTIEGDTWLAYARLEVERRGRWLDADHDLRLGAEVRREWNSGPGYQFEIEFPLQSNFNGVQGFDRPRRFDAIPPAAVSALYLDERVVRGLPGNLAIDLQAGLRLDVLHQGSTWLSTPRDQVLQPRFNVQFSPRPWLRLRAGYGRTAKQPPLEILFPAPQYFDVVNVNWFTSDPAERLAVLTTLVRDPTNPELGFARGFEREAGVELAGGSGDFALAVVAFRDDVERGFDFRPTPSFLPRDRYQLADSSRGTGRPPQIVEPPFRADTVPILIDVPANNVRLETGGWEITARFPEVTPLRTRLELQGAWIHTEMVSDALDFGLGFSDFQMDERIPRTPFWEDVRRTGERALLTYRLVHHRPEVGLVLRVTVEQVLRDKKQNVAGADILAFAGYVTRAGEIVRVPREQRGDPEFRDLRRPRVNVVVRPLLIAPDWLMSLQASLRLPLDGRLSFYAFNALDRKGNLGGENEVPRNYPGLLWTAGSPAGAPLEWHDPHRLRPLARVQ